jgi:HdeA/HdeB family
MRMLLIVVAAVAMAGVTAEAGQKVDLTKATCQDFLGMSDDIQPRAVAWLDGYTKGGSVKEDAIGEVDVDRETTTLVMTCKQNPKKSLWDVVKAHLPGGKKKVKPTEMTCQDYVDLTEGTAQPELLFFTDGYDLGAKPGTVTAREVDLQKNVDVVVQDCKQAPKESFWKRVKKHL